MHRVFGTKENTEYYDREGVYLIHICGDKVGVVRTPRGYFLVGGGIESGESHTECIERECAEETGYKAYVKGRLCSAETYCLHDTIGYFHPIQTYYVGEFVSKVSESAEKDHEFLWVTYDEIKGKMYFEMQDWALELVFEKICTE
ncbi:MAG: NUDIX domain-containing protein [Ruminococcus sp.]|uniref:NUDIX domain-containing protein n=1 Tax=Ruminococcus sp. TaxID=41978 RepID=UPI0025DF345B|nr:NUDIX domain-containing protein [Ruminococcus sp.]MCR4794698.1 NUDIX domain-containing protein [Ruminococcus sp.]